MEIYHKPVLLKEVIEYLDPKENEDFIDATFGFGGHSKEILKYNKPNGKILGLEWDPKIVEISKKIFMEEKRIKIRNENFKNIKRIAREEGFLKIKGVIFDLGVSSWHFEKSGRGFSFNKDEFLDMRINPDKTKLTAFEIVNYYSKDELIKIFERYGEERKAEKIADEIIKERKIKKIETSKELSEIISKVVKRRKINPATKTFMALRTFINQELENLEIGLRDAFDLLKSDGRIVVISFHGLENKVIKKVFKELKKEGGEILTKNVIKPSLKEIKENPRARSAQLRAIRKIK
ncbi:MAG: 16S rRNA (cytosine(1402)-N(4))-methyltransferase RsmH [Minisyncoccia bacterium]